jgi:two-component system OmpR family response regulator
MGPTPPRGMDFGPKVIMLEIYRQGGSTTLSKGGAKTMSRILFADSEPHIQQLCLEELQDEGYEVKVTGKGAEVVRLVESFKPDMVIMEVLLPDMSGVETGRMIKGTNRKTRVILYSYLSPPQDLSSWGADDFVVKSPNLDRLKAAVRRLLAA